LLYPPTPRPTKNHHQGKHDIALGLDFFKGRPDGQHKINLCQATANGPTQNREIKKLDKKKKKKKSSPAAESSRRLSLPDSERVARQPELRGSFASPHIQQGGGFLARGATGERGRALRQCKVTVIGRYIASLQGGRGGHFSDKRCELREACAGQGALDIR